MTEPQDPQAEESLDPGDWDAFARLAHRMLDDSLAYLKTVRERSAWQRIPESVQARLAEPLSREGTGEEAAYADYAELVAPYPLGNIHPRFWGWVIGTGTPLGVMAEMLAATMNNNAAGHRQSATFVEMQVLDWLKEIMGYPREAGGVLLSGGSVANQVGLAVARNAKAPFDVRREGLSGQPRLMFYTSSESHNSVQRAIELLGMGAESLGVIPVRADFTIDVAALDARIAADRKAGCIPCCVVANAGTVNTGAVDPLAELADVCARENLWLHVDGAFGALAVLDPETRPQLAGIERADSIAFDLHKWMYLPFEVACTLVRSQEAHTATFTAHADYLAQTQAGIASGPVIWADYAPQLSRSFRALKVWMNLKAYGVDRFARLIAQNIRQARYLAGLVEAAPELELLAPVPLNVVNFRYVAPGLDKAALNALNTRILTELQESGIAVPSSTILNGRFALRVAITNHRSRRDDFDALIAAVRALGRKLSP
ncbi:MAG: pyridoxal phosphate-dependent decarboxylase family protein [Gammaproteobacteria bacterium]